MTKLIVFISFAALVLFQSCDADKRHKHIGGKLTVYYFDLSEAEMAEKVAFFWKENDLLSSEKQDLQIQKRRGRYTLSLIANDPKSVDEMTIDEIVLLAQLKKKLWEEVFNEKSFDLEICNNRFESIYAVE